MRLDGAEDTDGGGDEAGGGVRSGAVEPILRVWVVAIRGSDVGGCALVWKGLGKMGAIRCELGGGLAETVEPVPSGLGG